ncbi:MAG: Uncharacterised protein [Bacteroidetes bacterium MED-G17]|nr:MAG: Uncharacterised protein [Bacteroidetes bacterium MED-G17]
MVSLKGENTDLLVTKFIVLSFTRILSKEKPCLKTRHNVVFFGDIVYI